MRVELLRWQRVVYWLPAAMFSAIGVAGGVALALTGRHWPSLLFFSSPALAWYSLRSIAWRLSREGDKLIAEYPGGRLASIAVAEVVGLDVRAWNRGVVVVATARQTMRLDRRMPGLARLLSDTFVGRADVRIRGSMPAYLLDNPGSMQPLGSSPG